MIAFESELLRAVLLKFDQRIYCANMIKNSQKQEVKIKQILQTKTAIMLKFVLLG